MLRSVIVSFATLFCSLAGIAFGECDKANLRETAESWDYLMKTGDHSSFKNLNHDLIYTENDQSASILTGIASQGLQISAHRTYYDTTLCKFVAEHVVTDPKHPYVIVTQTYVAEGMVEKIDVVVTDEGDFAFNATAYQDAAYAQAKLWDEIPESKRDSRGVLQAAADAYFQHLHDRSPFPVGPFCTVVSGGRWAGQTNATADTCTHKPKKPDDPTQTMRDRRYVIEEAYGVVNIFTRFEGLDRKYPNASTSDSHIFRIEEGKLRYVHSATVCISPLCGWPQS